MTIGGIWQQSTELVNNLAFFGSKRMKLIFRSEGRFGREMKTNWQPIWNLVLPYEINPFITLVIRTVGKSLKLSEKLFDQK